MSEWWILVMGLGLMSLVFLCAWVWGKVCDNYSLVDAIWAFGIGLTSCIWLLMSGVGLKHWVAAGMVAVWSLRLGLHLERRIRRLHPEEDARYAKLREVWTGRVASSFFWFFQAQGISVILLALPFLMISLDANQFWSGWESVGLATTLIGIFGEGIADSQIAKFKARNSDSRAVCREGLWRYTRHPNYFFEFIIWLGFFLYACGSEWGWATIHAPAMILYLLLKVTGIPPTEAAALRRKGAAYEAYQASTSAFVPWPPKQ